MASELLSLVNFHEYTLSDAQFKILCAGIAFIFTLSGITAVVAFPKDKRRMSWIISLVNSFVLSVTSSLYMYVKWPVIIADYRAFFHSADNVSMAIAVWLLMANIFDLAFGIVFYRAYLDPLSAYLHHTLYIWIMTVAISGNGGFANFEPFVAGSAFLLVEEIPTFLLAAGSVFPSLRTDLGFGFTFLVFRLGFHIAMLWAGVHYGIAKLVVGLFAITLVMHSFWFYTWFTKYGKKLLFGAKGEKAKQ